MPRSIPFGLVAGDLEPDSGRPKRSAWLLFAVSLGATVALEQLLELMMGDVPVLLLIVPVAVAALAGGFRLGVVATVVGSLLAAVLILQEHDAQTGGADRLRLAMFGLSGLILSALAERSRRALIREQAARRAAQASSALLDLISRSTPDLIFVRDLEGRLVYANDATIRVLGLEAGPAVGQRLADRFDPALGARVAASDHEVATTGAVVVTEDTVALPGGTRTFRTTKSPVRDSAAAVVGVVGVSTDVTEQRRVTEQVALRDRQLDLTLGASGFRTWEVTLDRDDLDADALLAAALAGLAPTGAVCPGDPIRSRLSRAIAERTGFTEELHLEGVGTGRGRWIELAGRVVDQHPPRVLGVARDVTHRREAQSELAEANARFELAAAAAAVAVWDYEFRTRTTRWTGDHHRLTGLPSDAAIDPRAVFRAIHPDDRVRVRDAIAERVAAGESDLELELRFVHGAGRIVWVGVRGRITYGPDGPLDIHGACFDITPRKRLEEERERLLESERYARSDAERATRLKDEFLATLSHELRTPLGAILGWTHLLRNRPYDAAKVHQGLEVIERNARVQTELIADLLDMSRILSGKMRLDVQRVDLTAVIDAAIEAVRPAADAREIRLERSDAATVELDGDPSRLQQVVWNLLSNAVKFTPRGGSVAVGITAVGSWVEVTVRDTGAGIDPAFLPYVFERFRQADASSARVHGGLGLGLAIVKHLVELHGGRVAAHSEGEGRGAAFLVELPQAGVALAEDDPSSFGDDPRTPSPAPPIDAERLRGLRVLVVDDEPDARDIVRRLLEEYAIEVFTAASADDGLALLATARPDLVVSDIGMPHKDGYQFIAAIRGRSDPVVAVALTAFARPEDRDRALAAGYQAHLAKPVRPTELLSTLSTLAVAAAGSRRG